MVKRGQILAGKYRVDRMLGMGGMGVVVAAQHVDLETRVALKFLLPESVSDKDAVERFTREAKASVSLRSEHAVRVYDTGKMDDGAPYMVMELLVGQNLAELLRERGCLAPAEAVDYMLQACEAIAEAHSKGLVHRDIKPSNLYRTTGVDGRPLIKVLDFGLAKRVDSLGASGGLTSTTAIMGSPHYMSPEQMRASRDIDARTDIWSLGVCLYELLSGRMPFAGETILELTASVLKDGARPLADLRPDLPPDLCRVVMQCLGKKPEDRIQDVGELAGALEAHARPVSTVSLRRIKDVLSAPRLPPVGDETLSRVDPLAPTRTARDFTSTLLQATRHARPRLIASIGALVAAAVVALVVGVARRGGPVVPIGADESRSAVARPLASVSPEPSPSPLPSAGPSPGVVSATVASAELVGSAPASASASASSARVAVPRPGGGPVARPGRAAGAHSAAPASIITDSALNRM